VLFDPLGDAFIRLLQMVIVPLVFTSLVLGIVNLGSFQHLGRIGTKTFFLFFLSIFTASLIGLAIVIYLGPGFVSEFDISHPISVKSVIPPSQESFSLSRLISEIIPSNSSDKILSVIFFSIFFGFGLLSLGSKAEPVLSFLEVINQAIVKITAWIVILTPFGTFALMSSMIGKLGFTAFKPLAYYCFTVILGLGIHVGIMLSILLIFIGKYSPIKFYRALLPAITTAFTTNSSTVALPVSMECLEKMGISRRICSLVTPLGVTFNKNGTAVFEVVSAVFIAQVYGIDLSLFQLAIVVLTSTLASIGSAGIPSGGMVSLVFVLRSVNLPLEGIGLIFAVDKLLDMFRTTVNVLGYSMATFLVAKQENEVNETSKSNF
jgi:Na+/H+-dicarboxylate symporter